MPHAYAVQFRMMVVEQVRSGGQVAEVVAPGYGAGVRDVSAPNLGIAAQDRDAEVGGGTEVRSVGGDALDTGTQAGHTAEIGKRATGVEVELVDRTGPAGLHVEGAPIGRCRHVDRPGVGRSDDPGRPDERRGSVRSYRVGVTLLLPALAT